MKLVSLSTVVLQSLLLAVAGLRAATNKDKFKFKYETKHMNPEMCHTLTDEQCQVMDVDFGRRALKNRKLLTDKGRRSLLLDGAAEPDSNSESDSKSDSDSSQRTRNLQTALQLQLINSGTMNILVVLVEFSDHAADNRPQVAPAEIEILFNSETPDPDHSPSGSVKEYFNTMSYGEFKTQATVATKWITTDNTELHYSQPNGGRTESLEAAFIPVLEELDDGSIDFSIFDHDGDFELDLVVFLHSGYDGVNGGVDCQNSAATSDKRIKAHARSNVQMEWKSNVGGYRVGSYAVASSMIGVCQTRVARLGVITHEMIHPFGLPDLYDLDGPFTPNTGTIGGISNYDIMGNPAGQGNKQAYPGHVSAWTRQFLGWADPIEITQDGTYTARAVADHPDIYKISQGYSSGEYLLMENRQPTPESFDQNFYNPGGIMIYHVDENVWQTGGYGNSPRGGTFQDNWPGNGLHYPLALLQADGAYDLEQALNGGEIEDLYNQASQSLGPGNGETSHNSAPYPNTDAYAFGDIRVTGITIDNFRPIEGTDPVTFQFDVSGLTQVDPPPTDAPVNPPTDAPVNPPTDAPMNPPTDAPVNPPTDAPVNPPTDAPVNPPTNTPVDAPTDAPVNPPTDAPVEPPTDAPVNPPTDAPVNPPTDAPVNPPTDAPVNPPTDAPVNPPTDAPVNPPTDAPVNPPTDAPVNPPTDAPVNPPTNTPVDAPTNAPVNPPTDAPVEPPTNTPSNPTVDDAIVNTPSNAPVNAPTNTNSATPAPVDNIFGTPAPVDAPAVTSAPVDANSGVTPTSTIDESSSVKSDSPDTVPLVLFVSTIVVAVVVVLPMAAYYGMIGFGSKAAVIAGHGSKDAIATANNNEMLLSPEKIVD